MIVSSAAGIRSISPYQLVNTGICVHLIKVINVKIVFRWFVFYDIVLPEILPIFFWIFTCFSFLINTSICIGFWKADVRNRIPDILPLLQTQSAVPRQMQDAIGFFLLLCSIMFPLYHNRICCDFQRIRSIFYVKNITRNSESICIAVLHQNGISCRNGYDTWDIFHHQKTGFGFANRNDKKKQLYLLIAAYCFVCDFDVGLV